MIKIKGRVIKGVGGDFWLSTPNGVVVTKARKKLKEDKILIGDFVEVDLENKVIEKVYPRSNALIRPEVANVEQVLIIIAPIPKPDFTLIDKLLIKFLSLGITPVLVINKMDLTEKQFIVEIESQYKPVCKILKTSVLDVERTNKVLLPVLKDKFSVLTGQSAVGKTSILKTLLPNVNMEIGDLSLKTARGKNTTRHSEIFLLNNGGLLADTPGFNAFELDDYSPQQILDNCPEFAEFNTKCKFNNCSHIAENISICGVKQAVRDKLINIDRYNRYCDLYKQAKEKESKKYE